MQSDSPYSPEFIAALKDETPEEFKSRMENLESKLEQEREEKLRKLSEKTPVIIQLAEKKLANEKLDQQLEEIEHLEVSQQNYTTLSLEQLYQLEFPAESWIIDRIIPSSGITLFVGESGVGKSYIALEVVRSIISQDIFLDHFEIKNNGAILIIDKENGLRRIQKRTRDMGIPASDKVFTLQYPEHFTLDNQEFMDSVATFIKDNDIKIVILDSLIDVIMGSENDSGDTAKVFNAIKSISSTVCWVILHHDSKPMPHSQRTAGQKTRGSSNIIAQVDNQFYIEKTKSLKVVNIEQGKSRDNEPVAKFAVEFLSDPIGNMSGFKYIGEVQSESSRVDEAILFIEGLLQDQVSKSRQDIIDSGESQGISKSSITRALKTLNDKNILDSVADGRRKLFFLADEGRVSTEEA